MLYSKTDTEFICKYKNVNWNKMILKIRKFEEFDYASYKKILKYNEMKNFQNILSLVSSMWYNVMTLFY